MAWRLAKSQREGAIRTFCFSKQTSNMGVPYADQTVDSVENQPLSAPEVLLQSRYRRFWNDPSDWERWNMYRLLLIDQDAIHAERLATCLRERGLAVMIAESVEESVRQLQQRLPSYELVVVVASGMPEQWLAILRRLVGACRQCSMCQGPLFLVASSRKCPPHLRLRIEHLGARYVRER
jgi:CheY-like chemotaxis protein